MCCFVLCTSSFQGLIFATSIYYFHVCSFSSSSSHVFSLGFQEASFLVLELFIVHIPFCLLNKWWRWGNEWIYWVQKESSHIALMWENTLMVIITHQERRIHVSVGSQMVVSRLRRFPIHGENSHIGYSTHS